MFVDFEGVMTASTVWINGAALGEYRGGYTPFSFELTPHLHGERDNVLSVEVDSTERADIPPFGDAIDYLTFGGIYRERPRARFREPIRKTSSRGRGTCWRNGRRWTFPHLWHI